MPNVSIAFIKLSDNYKLTVRQILTVISLAFAMSLAACTSAETTETEKETQTNVIKVHDFTANQQREALNRLAKLLEDLYVFPDKGSLYAKYLRERTATIGNVDKEEFANLITEELRNIHKDAHLRVEVEEQNNEGPGLNNTPPETSLNTLFFPAAEIAYIRFDALWGDPETMSTLREFADESESVRSVIIDLRKNRGGGLAEIDFFASELFAESTDLLVMEVRRTIYEMEGGPFGEGPTLQKTDSPEASVRLLHKVIPADSPKLLDKKVYILTSSMTASAAEHFALAMQRTSRATVVGETSKGAAHFGGLMPIGNGLRAFVPAGRTYNPDTGNSWEGVGVQPDINSLSADALIATLKDIGVNASQAVEINNMVSAIPL